LDDEQIIQAAKANQDEGVNRFAIVTAGKALTGQDFDKAIHVYERMNKELSINLCASMGFITREQFKRLKKAGVTSYHHNIETSRRFFPQICTSHTYDDRIRTIKIAQEEGFCVCSGGIIGMGETPEDVVDMLFELLEINPDSVPINFLLPVKGTRLAERDISALTPEYCIKVLCLARLMLPKSDIRCAAGREVYFKGHEKTLFKIADSIFASGYLTEGGQSLEETFRTIEAAGFTWQVESEASH
jgi:biotin synthase